MKRTAITLLIGVGLAGAANASEILVNSDISVSTTWTADNTYNLQKQIYVLPGASLTIQAGTIVASDTGIGGSLAVTKGAQIFVQGTQANPVIMTSKADVATWTGGDPKTGVWREAATEWGNLSLMGAAYISENATPGNVPTCNANNVADLEGLVAGFPGDTKIQYGGGDDNDDTGTIQYLSLRYGGKVVALNVELNGLSLGGIGRGTDINHIDIMNNVDDGVEIFGGAVNLKYFNIWNIGDDSFDIDQGWRGKAQFLCLVQGYSLDASQGSGVGDNVFETDGAEDSDWQPVSTAAIYNATCIGQPVDGDHATAWRDNARIQYHQCTFMDIGDEVVRFDNVDGDGASGYGFNGTLSWPDTWTTPYNMVPPTPNDCPAGTYTSQVDGNLAEMVDCVYFRNQSPNAYTEANNRSVFDATNDNVLIPGFDDASAPVRSVVRAAPVVKGGLTMLQVIGLDPRPMNEALTAVRTAPNDGFFTPVDYRGAFDPNTNWLCGWTAADAFGFVIRPTASATSRNAGANPSSYTITSLPTIGGTLTAQVDLTTTGHAFAQLVGYQTPLTLPLSGGRTLLVNPTDPAGELLAAPLTAGPTAIINLSVPNDLSFCGFTLSTQAIQIGGVQPFALSNAQDLVVGV